MCEKDRAVSASLVKGFTTSHAPPGSELHLLTEPERRIRGPQQESSGQFGPPSPVAAISAIMKLVVVTCLLIFHYISHCVTSDKSDKFWRRSFSLLYNLIIVESA